MIILYLVSGPVIAAVCFVVVTLFGGGMFAGLVSGFILGIFTPALIAGLHFAFNSELKMKIVSKLPMNTEY